MDHKTHAGPFAPIDTSKGPIANSRRAAALALAVSRAPLSWHGDELFKLADKFVEYINGERAVEDAKAMPQAEPNNLSVPTLFYRSADGRMFAWDACNGRYREVVHK